MATSVTFAGEFTSEEAIKILETSSKEGRRLDALVALLNTPEGTLAASPFLARMLATDPSRSEATAACESLGRMGVSGMPLVARLVSVGWGFAFHCQYVARRYPLALQSELLRAFEPVFQSDLVDARVDSVVALRWNQLPIDAANSLSHELMADRRLWPSVALFILPKGNDANLLETIRSHRSAYMQYIATRIQEDWRRRDSRIHQMINLWHVPRPLPEAEQLRCNQAEAQLAELARGALPEVLQNLDDSADARSQYIWLEMLLYLGAHADLKTEKVRRTLDELPRERGTTIDWVISGRREEIFH